jgi:hypothetical protein
VKKVDQTIFGTGKGNCFAACVASILELPIEEVPNFCDAPGNWLVPFKAWLAERGLFAIIVEHATCVDSARHFIACGDYEGPTGNGPHAVVYENAKLSHNPNPRHEGRDLAQVHTLVFLVRAP